jgi:hypothetical protein
MFSLSSGGPLQHLSPFNQVINIYMPRAVARYTSDIIPTRLTREQRTFTHPIPQIFKPPHITYILPQLASTFCERLSYFFGS